MNVQESFKLHPIPSQLPSQSFVLTYPVFVTERLGDGADLSNRTLHTFCIFNCVYVPRRRKEQKRNTISYLRTVPHSSEAAAAETLKVKLSVLPNPLPEKSHSTQFTAQHRTISIQIELIHCRQLEPAAALLPSVRRHTNFHIVK